MRVLAVECQRAPIGIHTPRIASGSDTVEESGLNMSVSSFEIRSRIPYESGNALGTSSPYEILRGVVSYSVDPLAKENERIADLRLADTDDSGRVQFDADFVILRPLDAGRSNRRLLYVVNNRGRTGALPFSTNTEITPADEIHPGDGLLLQQGWTIAYSGWQWDVIDAPGVIGIRVPEAKIDGAPIEGVMRVDFRSDDRISHHLLSDSTGAFAFAAYSAADLDQADAVLTVRASATSEPTTIERSRWRFAREVDGNAVPDADYIWLEGGFEPFSMYEVRYRTNRSPVAGVGFIAPREFLSFIRYDQSPSNPLAGEIDHVFGAGASQTGRYLRHFVYDGMNVDDQGRQLLDGIFPHIAGARRGEFNERYAQPSHIGYTGLSILPPYSINEPDGLYDVQRRLGGVPKTIFTNTAWEYWRSDAALNHIDPALGTDRDENDESRSYLLAGIDHMGASPQKSLLPVANRANPLGYTLLVRAAFQNLVRWVCEGVEPPPSRVPRIADGTAVHRDAVIAKVAGLPGAVVPDVAVLPLTREVDFGPKARQGVASWPPVEGREVACFVSAVDDDLNEIAGIRLPELQAPVAAYTGWNPVPGGSRALREFCGSVFPFPLDDAAAERTGDSRPTITARYPNRASYEAAAETAIDLLVSERFLLKQDANEALASALALYDAYTQAPTDS